MHSIPYLFFKNNIHRYKSIFISIIAFVFVINLVSIFLLGMTSGLKEQVTDNDNLKILELYPRTAEDTGLTREQLAQVQKIPGVVDAYYIEQANIECENVSTGDSYCFTIYKLAPEYLKYYGLPETDDEEYVYISKESLEFNLTSDTPTSPVGKTFKAYYSGENEKNNANKPITFHVTDFITLSEHQDIEDFFLGESSFADPKTFDCLQDYCEPWENEEISYDEFLADGISIHVVVPDVAKQDSIAEQIEDMFPNIKVSYALGRAAKLPMYVEIFLDLGIALLIILVIAYFVSIRNNIANVLNFRANGVRLFHTIGVDPPHIVKHFYTEFLYLGVFSWVIQILLTLATVFIAKMLLNMELYSQAIVIVLLCNLILLVLGICGEGYFVIKRNVNRLLKEPS